MTNKKNQLLSSGAALLFGALVGCGVRGKPQPPLTPAELGRGRPSFHRATKGFKFQDVPPVQTDPAAKNPEDDHKD